VIAELEPGGRVETHLHAFEEAFYVLEGELVFEAAGATEKLAVNDYAFVDRGVGHALRNDSGATVRWLEVCAPQPGATLEDTVFAEGHALPEGLDVPYWRGPAELIHLLSVISPIADDLAVVYLPLLPVGLRQLHGELGIRLLEVTDEEFATLGCNVLAVRPGVVMLAEGNPRTAAALAEAGCEVHTYPATEIGINGSGGPTCLTRPILRG